MNGSVPSGSLNVSKIMLSSSVLVLNRSYLPINVTSVRRAFSLIYQGGAKAVDSRYETFDFERWVDRGMDLDCDKIGTLSGDVAVPRVIVLTAFDRMPKRHVRFSRIACLPAALTLLCARSGLRCGVNRPVFSRSTAWAGLG